MTNAGGFSLLELMVVLSLVAILGGISVISQQAMRPALDLSMAARQVAIDLKVARMRAVTDNANYRVAFVDGGTTYQHQRKNGDGYVDDGIPIALPRGIVIAECTATDNAISFRPRGHAATFGTVTIRNGKGDLRKVVVDIAGQVRVQ